MKTLPKTTRVIGVRRKDVSVAGCIGEWEDFDGTLEDVILDLGKSITHIMTNDAEYPISQVACPPENLTEGATVKSVWAGDIVEGKLVEVKSCQKFGYYNVYISEDGGDPICVPAETCVVAD